MNYSFELKDHALNELTEAFLWYEKEQEGLGYLFRTKFLEKLNKICNNPYHYKVSYKNCHEALTDKFPFLIVYKIDEKAGCVIVVAIFHTSRNPKKKFRR
jgi:plasmid stabilization system protein ParE